jgi:hypothetical protein
LTRKLKGVNLESPASKKKAGKKEVEKGLDMKKVCMIR